MVEQACDPSDVDDDFTLRNAELAHDRESPTVYTEFHNGRPTRKGSPRAMTIRSWQAAWASEA